MGYMAAIGSGMDKYEMANGKQPHAIVASWDTIQRIADELGHSANGAPQRRAGSPSWWLWGVPVWTLDTYATGHIGLVSERLMHDLGWSPSGFADVEMPKPEGE